MRFRSDSFRAFGPSQFTRRSLNIASARSRSAGRTQKKNKRQYFVGTAVVLWTRSWR